MRHAALDIKAIAADAGKMMAMSILSLLSLPRLTRFAMGCCFACLY